MELEFSDEPIVGIEKEFDVWVEQPEFAPPVPAGTYRVYVDQVRKEEQFECKIDDKDEKRYRCIVDFRVIGGQHDGRTITYQRLTNRESERKSTGTRSSQLVDLYQVLNGDKPGPLRSNNDFHKLILAMKDKGAALWFGVQLDWRGFCSTCYERKLMELTNTVTADAAKDAAKDNPEFFNEASDAALKAKNYRGFEELPNGAGRKDTFICKDCKEEVRASVRLTRFVKDVK